MVDSTGSSPVAKNLTKLAAIGSLLVASAFMSGCRDDEVAAATIGGIAGLVIGGSLARGSEEEGYYVRRQRVCETAVYQDSYGYREWHRQCYLTNESTKPEVVLSLTQKQIGDHFKISMPQAGTLMTVVEEFGKSIVSPEASAAGFQPSSLAEVFLHKIPSKSADESLDRLARAMDLDPARLRAIIAEIRAKANSQNDAAKSRSA